MIEVTLEELAVTLIGFTMLVIVLSVLSTRLSEALRRSRLERRRLDCRVCGMTWEDSGVEKLVECPNCQRKAQRGRDLRMG